MGAWGSMKPTIWLDTLSNGEQEQDEITEAHRVSGATAP
ncbi:MAG: hypothetical protein K0R47_2810 [Brevibacillus sp.]|nr:hypothetical protein [Brevibacillus sp.]